MLLGIISQLRRAKSFAHTIFLVLYIKTLERKRLLSAYARLVIQGDANGGSGVTCSSYNLVYQHIVV